MSDLAQGTGPRERLGLDCDGVLADFSRYCLARINRELGTAYRARDWPNFMADESLGKVVGAIVWRLMDQPDLWAAVPPYPGTARRVATLRERYDIYVVTAIPTQFREVRAEWLTRHGVACEGLVAVASPDEKATVAAELGLCAFVEDLVPTAEQLAAQGIASYLVRRPWNDHLPLRDGVRRGTWAQILPSLLRRPGADRR